MDSKTDNAIDLAPYRAMGWQFIRLRDRDKRPLDSGWSDNPPDQDMVAAHGARGGNVGLLTGRVSGVVVVDLDPGAPDTESLGLPGTVTAQTGRGGFHLYYALKDRSCHNSAGKLAPHVDVRGDGGYVVFPGSIHPSGTHYEWLYPPVADDPEDCAPLVPAPDLLFTAPDLEPAPKPKPEPTPKLKHDGPRISRTTPERWWAGCLKIASQRVANAPQGKRNDTLNEHAYSLGRIIGAGHGSAYEAESILLSAALAAGLTESEALATIASGLTDGQASPREPSSLPDFLEPRPVFRTPDTSSDQPEVLIPGGHTDDEGVHEFVGNDQFVDRVLAALPPDVIYTRAGQPGVIDLGQHGRLAFCTLDGRRAQVVMDRHVALTQWKNTKDAVYKDRIPTTYPLAELVLSQAPHAPHARRLNLLVDYPVVVPAADQPEGYRLAQPGWNETAGVYYDASNAVEDLAPLDSVEEAREVLEDVLSDFPWVSPADRANYVALLYTALVAPIIDGARPLFLITSPMPRSGKTKLAEDVLGGIIRGRRTPAQTLGGTDEEREKRIFAAMMRHENLLHLDNLPHRLDSQAIASILTAKTYSSRVLGQSLMLDLPNHLTMVATGNNVACSAEITKRTIPIRLQPETAHPEARTDFKYPDLWGRVLERRHALLCALLTGVQAWIDSRRRANPCIVLGGFEEWARSVGSIMIHAGWPEAFSNLTEWRAAQDYESRDMADLFARWWDCYGPRPVSQAEIIPLVDGLESWEWVSTAPSPKAVQARAGKRLARYVGAAFGQWRLTHAKTMTGAVYALRETEEPCPF
jgi:hypothetical protein